MKQFLEKHPLILMEAAVTEPLSRLEHISIHPGHLISPLIYDPVGRRELAKLYRDYWEIAKEAQLPFIMLTPTWKTDYGRVKAYGLNPNINTDAVHFMVQLCHTLGVDSQYLKIGGLIGCKNDCYQPGQGLSALKSEQFHSRQIAELARAGVDFLIAQTLPNVDEAIGVAKAMENTGRPYIVSFVINRDGKVLDGTDLSTAMDIIDAATHNTPLGYMINCSYPTFLHAAEKSTALATRLIGCQANASALDHDELDNADQLHAEDVSKWGTDMLSLNKTYGIRILGGCCGTGVEHLKYLIENRSPT